MTRRKEARIYAEELSSPVGIKKISIAGLEACWLIDLSRTGLSVGVTSTVSIQVGEDAEMVLSLPNQKDVVLQLRAMIVADGRVSFSIVSGTDGNGHYNDFISSILDERVRNNAAPPQQWGIADQHFMAAITDPWYKLLFQMLGDIVYKTNDFYKKHGYVPALMPITVESVSSPMGLGSDSLPVKVNLFGKPTYLADSMQFQLEYLLRHQVPGVFYVMPTFRGETPDDRHLNQFFHSEAEMQGELSDVMPLIEMYIAELSESLLSRFDKEISRYTGRDTSHIRHFLSVAGKIPRIEYEEACVMLGNNSEYYSELPGKLRAISRVGEKELMRRHNGFAWIMYPPHGVVPFYQAFCDDKTHAKSADLLMGIGETVGCGERHCDADEAIKALALHQVSPSEYSWYLRMKREFPMKTSGFGMGIERYLLWILKHNDIRDIALLSRLKDIPSAP